MKEAEAAEVRLGDTDGKALFCCRWLVTSEATRSRKQENDLATEVQPRLRRSEAFAKLIEQR